MAESGTVLKLSELASDHLEEIMCGVSDGTDPRCIRCAEILVAMGIDPATVERRPSIEPRFRYLLSTLKQWRNATESRLRLRLLDSRGEAAKSMLKADRDLVEALERVEQSSGEG